MVNNKKECESNAQLVSLSMQRDLEQDNGHFSDLDRRKSGTLLGQNCRIDDDQICRKHTPSLPIHESIFQRSAEEQRWWKIVDTLLRRPGKRLKLFLAQLFL